MTVLDPTTAVTMFGACLAGLVVLGAVLRRDLSRRPPRDHHDETPTSPGLRLVD